MTTKNMQLMKSIHQLEAGDVVLFRSVYHKNWGQTIIGYCQSLISNEHGHYETVHAGICVGHGQNGPKIAHVTGGKIFGYAIQNLVDINAEDQENRSLLIYRHKNSLTRELIANRAADIANLKIKPQWTFTSAFKLLFPSANKVTSPDEISLSTICSKFTIEILQQVTKNCASYLNMHSTSTPKALEAELYKNTHYDLLIYTGSPDPKSQHGLDPFLTVKNTMENELCRLKQKSNNNIYIRQKYKQVKAAIFKGEQLAQDEKDTLKKAQYLLQEVMPSLAINTGYSFGKPTSYNNVAEQARRLGIFKWNNSAHIQAQNVFDECNQHKYLAR